jgi:ATP-dependent helicase HrpB
LRDSSRLVLRAPPGAGKTTRVPAALLDAGLAGDRSVLVLEPRRIAARAAAAFVAAERGKPLGLEVGYRVRFEQRGGDETRLWFLTEGVLGRQLASDPFLEAAAVVVLDEFHERHLQGDIALAVVRELQATVRPDLKLVVMSATLETAPLARYLGDCPVLTSEGRSFPVQIEYQPAADDRRLSARVATTLRRALTLEAAGDVLVFLPGAADIRRAAEAIEPLATEHALDVLPLHGDLPLDEQQRVLARGRRRKVVLSTNVAETSLTIDGVTLVIDSGLARVARFDARRGVNVLRTAPISRASAEQRAGRAGRTAPGRCLRLWTEAEHRQRLEREAPEILRLDLADTVLQLRAWGLRDLREFGWLDPPRAGILQGAENLLVRLGAVDPISGAVTDLGRRMLTIAAHPRLARLLVEGERRDCLEAAALAAALASERDICTEARAFGTAAGVRAEAGPSDLLHRAELFHAAERNAFERATCARLDLDPGALRAADRTRRQLLRAMRSSSRRATEPPREDDVLRAILAGFPDRVVKRRGLGSRRGVMVGGTGVVLGEGSVVREADLFVAVDVEAGESDGGREARVRLASAIDESWLQEMDPHAVRTERALEFDERGGRVVERTRRLYEDLVLAEAVRTDVDRSAAGEVLAAAVRRDPERAAVVGDAERAFLDRVRFLRRWMPEADLPEPAGLLAEAVAALCMGKRSLAELRDAEILPVLQGMLTHAQRSTLERQAPQRFELPTGRSVAIAYDDPQKPPSVAARVQELFGLTTTPRLAAGRVALVFEILAPSRRPVQVTDDLESFWKRGYPEVRKQLRGRYPKHAWPEDPLAEKKR